MYLFTRSARLAPGHTRQSMHWAEAITEKVNQISSLEVSLYARMLSPGVNTLTWAAQSDNLQAFDDTEAKLMVDEGYLSLLDEGAEYSAGEAINDAVYMVVAPSQITELHPHFVSVVTATIRPTMFREAMEVGTLLARQAEQISGRPTSFCAAATGTYGAVQWLATHDSLDQMQRAQELINSDTSFLELLDTRASAAFAPGQQMVARRLI